MDGVDGGRSHGVVRRVERRLERIQIGSNLVQARSPVPNGKPHRSEAAGDTHLGVMHGDTDTGLARWERALTAAGPRSHLRTGSARDFDHLAGATDLVVRIAAQSASGKGAPPRYAARSARPG